MPLLSGPDRKRLLVEIEEETGLSFEEVVEIVGNPYNLSKDAYRCKWCDGDDVICTVCDSWGYRDE